MSAWLMERFKRLRLELVQRDQLVPFLRALHRLGSPGGELSLYEVIDGSTPELWDAAVAQINAGAAAQPGLLAEVEHER